MTHLWNIEVDKYFKTSVNSTERVMLNKFLEGTCFVICPFFI